MLAQWASTCKGGMWVMLWCSACYKWHTTVPVFTQKPGGTSYTTPSASVSQPAPTWMEVGPARYTWAHARLQVAHRLIPDRWMTSLKKVAGWPLTTTMDHSPDCWLLTLTQIHENIIKKVIQIFRNWKRFIIFWRKVHKFEKVHQFWTKNSSILKKNNWFSKTN